MSWPSRSNESGTSRSYVTARRSHVRRVRSAMLWPALALVGLLIWCGALLADRKLTAGGIVSETVALAGFVSCGLFAASLGRIAMDAAEIS